MAGASTARMTHCNGARRRFSMRPVAIFRFSPTEGPGHFGEWLERHRVPHRIVALDHGEPVPDDVRAFAGIGMMGGPMSANDPLPWNAPLLALLREAVADDVPVIGHCLGGQLFAKALGAPRRADGNARDRLGRGERAGSRRDAPGSAAATSSRPSNGITTSSSCRRARRAC